MAKKYASIAFSAAAKALQEQFGSRASYARMEQQSYFDGLTDNETAFIEERDSLYIATIGANGFPYIQHRGGPKGFVHVLDAHHIAFVDFKGNKQFVTAGNLFTQNKVALIMVDYPTRTRLKIFATARIVQLADDPALFAQLKHGQYSGKPEWMIVLTIEAYDWNCPQHLTPRYTIEEIQKVMALQKDYTSKLEAEIVLLKQKLAAQQA